MLRGEYVCICLFGLWILCWLVIVKVLNKRSNTPSPKIRHKTLKLNSLLENANQSKEVMVILKDVSSSLACCSWLLVIDLFNCTPLGSTALADHHVVGVLRYVCQEAISAQEHVYHMVHNYRFCDGGGLAILAGF